MLDRKKVKIGKEYRIKGKSKYFKKKYGTSNPIIRIGAKKVKPFRGWRTIRKNPDSLDYISYEDTFYGKIRSSEELVHISQLEEKNVKK